MNPTTVNLSDQHLKWLQSKGMKTDTALSAVLDWVIEFERDNDQPITLG